MTKSERGARFGMLAALALSAGLVACAGATAPGAAPLEPALREGRSVQLAQAAGMAAGGTTPLPSAKALPRPSPAAQQVLEGDRALSEDRFDRAHEHFEQASRLDPSDPGAALGLLRVRWARLGIPFAYAEAPHRPELEQLASDIDALLSRHADYAPALLEKGRLLLVLGDAPAALDSLRRSVALDDTQAEAHSALGVALLGTGETEQALQELIEAARIRPDEPEGLTNLGTAYMLRGRLSEAIAAYERSFALRPDDARTAGDLGAAHLANDRADKALPYLLRATALAPGRATFLTNLGYAYQRQGQLDKAVETQRRALAIDPKLGSAWINLGNALAELKQYAQAEAALRQAAKLDPDDPRPKASLQDLAELKARARPAARP